MGPACSEMGLRASENYSGPPRPPTHGHNTYGKRKKRKNKRKLFTRTGRLLGPHFPRKSQAEPRAKIGHTEAVFESAEVGMALNTIPRLVLDIHECRTWP